MFRQNLKQKIVNLLKKFKATEEGHRGSETKPGGAIDNIDNIDELFDELEGLSDSEPDADTLSVGSFPKPVLPPFFASSRSLAQYSKGLLLFTFVFLLDYIIKCVILFNSRYNS